MRWAHWAAHSLQAAIPEGTDTVFHVAGKSISAYGPVEGEITEETPSLAAKASVNYQKTKWQARELARAAACKGLEVVIMQSPGTERRFLPARRRK